MNVDKINNYLSNKYYNEIRKKKLGYISNDDNMFSKVLYSCLSVVLNNDGFFEEQDIDKLIKLIKA